MEEPRSRENSFFYCFRQVWGPIYNDRENRAVNEWKVRGAINDQTNNHSMNNLMNEGPVPSYNDIFKMAAYMYKYAYHHAVILYGTLCNARVRNYLTRKEEWNICTLGDAAGVSNVPTMKVLDNFNKFTAGGVKTVNNIAVDISESWAPHFYEVMKRARRQFRLPSGEDTFLQQDLLDEDWSEEVKEAIQEADIICLNKFCTYIFRKSEYTGMLQNIFMSAKPGAMVILIDYLYDVDGYKVIPDAIEEQLEEMNFAEILKDQVKIKSCMDIEQDVRNFFDHCPFFGTSGESQTHHACVWVKLN